MVNLDLIISLKSTDPITLEYTWTFGRVSGVLKHAFLICVYSIASRNVKFNLYILIYQKIVPVSRKELTHMTDALLNAEKRCHGDSISSYKVMSNLIFIISLFGALCIRLDNNRTCDPIWEGNVHLFVNCVYSVSSRKVMSNLYILIGPTNQQKA